MNGKPAYYSVVQYVPDPGRLEGANLGVVLLCPDAGYLEIKLSHGNDRVARFFGRASFDPVRLNSAKRALEDRLSVERDRLLDRREFEQFALTRANEIRLSPPRPMTVMNPSAELDELFDELAGQRDISDVRSHTRLGRKLKAIFEGPDLVKLVRKDVEVTVPITGKVLTAPYAWLNGHVNLVKPLHVNSKALSQAMDLALEGDLLHRHAAEMAEPAELVVAVGRAAASDEEIAEVVKRLLGDYGVPVYDESRLDELERKVAQEAHAFV